MTSIKRPLAAAGAAVLLGLTLSACGGAPTDASKADFCKAYQDQSWFTDVKEDDYDGFADALHDYADKLEDVGTPDDISDDEREGFEIGIDQLKDVSADDLEKASEQENADDLFDADLSKDEKEKADAFEKYADDKCGEA